MFWGPNGLFLGSGLGRKIVFGSTHIAEQLLFSIVPLILTFDCDLIFGTFFTFLGPNRLFLGSGRVSKQFWGLFVKCRNGCCDGCHDGCHYRCRSGYCQGCCY